MSEPSRTTFPTPIGTVYSSSGTTAFSRYTHWCSMKNTGLSSRMALFSSPFMS